MKYLWAFLVVGLLSLDPAHAQNNTATRSATGSGHTATVAQIAKQMRQMANPFGVAHDASITQAGDRHGAEQALERYDHPASILQAGSTLRAPRTPNGLHDTPLLTQALGSDDEYAALTQSGADLIATIVPPGAQSKAAPFLGGDSTVQVQQIGTGNPYRMDLQGPSLSHAVPQDGVGLWRLQTGITSTPFSIE